MDEEFESLKPTIKLAVKAWVEKGTSLSEAIRLVLKDLGIPPTTTHTFTNTTSEGVRGDGKGDKGVWRRVEGSDDDTGRFKRG